MGKILAYIISGGLVISFGIFVIICLMATIKAVIDGFSKKPHRYRIATNDHEFMIQMLDHKYILFGPLVWQDTGYKSKLLGDLKKQMEKLILDEEKPTKKDLSKREHVVVNINIKGEDILY